MLKRIVRAIKANGILKTAKSAMERFPTWFNERRLGISTSESFDRAQLGYSTIENHMYSPTDYRSFRKIMRHVEVKADEDVFLDYGSGTGRVLVMAGAYPFRRIIGVELSRELTARAAANVQNARRRLKCRDIELVETDATTYRVPLDVTVIYFYNPFRGKVLRRVLDNLHASLTARARKLTIVYRNCEFLQREAKDYAWLVKRAEFRNYSKHCYCIYESTELSTAAGRPTRDSSRSIGRCGKRRSR